MYNKRKDKIKANQKLQRLDPIHAMSRPWTFLLCLYSWYALLLVISAQHTHTESTEEHKLVNISVLNRTFFVGSVHADWIPEKEIEVLKSFDRILSPKINNCNVVDVGMNDGFYTHFSTTYGCKVWAFEIQSDCIAFSRKITKANNASHLVNIIRAPVSNRNGESIPIPTGDADQRNRCDGGFSLFGKAHKAYKITHYRHLDSVSLDGFFPANFQVDVLKMDVEGHESAALEGALSLFKEKRIQRGLIEVITKIWKVDKESGLKSFEKIFSYGYTAICLTGEAKEKLKGEAVTYPTFVENIDLCIDWDFFPKRL